MRELQPPSTQEGHERRRTHNPRVVVLRVTQPRDLEDGGEEEWHEEEEWSETGCLLLTHGDADIVVAVVDVEGKTKGTKDHEGFVERQVG